MKVALCFSGQPRFIEQMNLNNLIQDHEVDIYAHFWWDESHKGQEFATMSTLRYDDSDPISKFKDLFNPKKIVFEDYPQLDMSGYAKRSLLEIPLSTDIVADHLYRQRSMWTSVKKSLELVEGNYDVVVRARTDLIYKDKVPLSSCSGDGIYIMNGSIQSGVGRELCDWFYCGSLNRMKQFDVLPTHQEFNKDGLRHIHEMMWYSLSRYQIPYCTPDLKVWLLNRSEAYAQFEKQH